jgi:Ca2+-binding EF-hand superfamily protein
VKRVLPTANLNAITELFHVCLTKQENDRKELRLDTFSNWLQIEKGTCELASSSANSIVQMGKTSVEDDVKAVHKVFVALDVDGNNYLDGAEFSRVIRAVGNIKLNEKDLYQLMHDLGGKQTKYDGFVLYEDRFIAGVIKHNIPGITVTSITKWQRKHAITSNHLSTCVQALLLLHSPVSQKAFLYFAVHRLGHRRLLKSDYTVELGSNGWLLFLPLVIVILAGFTIALPIVLSSILFCNRKNLNAPNTRSTIGWLYNRYNHGVEFWEIFELMRKMILTGLLVYLPSTARASVAICICLIAVCVLNFFRPQSNTLVFWINNLAYVAISLKYLMTIVLDLASAYEYEVELSIALITIDCATMGFTVLGISMILLRLKKLFTTLSKDDWDKTEEQLKSQIAQQAENDTKNEATPTPKSLKWNSAFTRTEMHLVQKKHGDFRKKKIQNIGKHQNLAKKRLRERLENRKKFQQKMNGQITKSTKVIPLNNEIVTGDTSRKTALKADKGGMKGLAGEDGVEQTKNSANELLQTLCHTFVTKIKSFERLKKAFCKLDKDNSGGLALPEFTKLVKGVIKAVDLKLVEEVFEACLLQQSNDEKEVLLITFSKWLNLHDIESPTLNDDGDERRGKRESRML